MPDRIKRIARQLGAPSEVIALDNEWALYRDPDEPKGAKWIVKSPSGRIIYRGAGPYTAILYLLQYTDGSP
jgi:hypothetical protein